MGILEFLIPNDIAVVGFDFSGKNYFYFRKGCGLSEGKYISLGFYEKDDV